MAVVREREGSSIFNNLKTRGILPCPLAFAAIFAAFSGNWTEVYVYDSLSAIYINLVCKVFVLFF